ncbi:MAG: hypothetical protein KDD10_15390, partial [Phaeodactylibacter sp.]|nr:hypothetical protein [Phaeodactylibacter sp.]
MAIKAKAGNWIITVAALSLTLSTYGQDCGKDCPCILDNARRAAVQEQPDFQRALSLFNAAKLCFPDSVQVIDREVVAMFERINNLKQQAGQAEARARQEAERASTALDSVIILQEATEAERQRAQAAQAAAERARDTLATEKENAQRQYLLAEARRLDNIARDLAVDKKHTEAWVVGLHKWKSLGDSLGGSLDSLAMDLFEGSEKILLRKSVYFLQDTSNVVEVELGARRLLLAHYRDGRAELQTLTGDVLYTFRLEGLKKTIFSPDGSRVGLFSRRRAEVYRLADKEGALDIQLEKSYDPGRDKVEKLVFAPDNEAFVVTDTVFFSLNRPKEVAYTYSHKKIIRLQPFPASNFRVGVRLGYAFLYQYKLVKTDSLGEEIILPELNERLLIVTPPSERGIRKVKITSFDSEDIHIAPSGRFIIGRADKGRIKYMDENGRLLAYFEGRNGQLEVTPYDTETGIYLLTHDSSHLWAWTRKGANIARIDEAAASLKGLRFSPDNAYLFTWS